MKVSIHSNEGFLSTKDVLEDFWLGSWNKGDWSFMRNGWNCRTWRAEQLIKASSMKTIFPSLGVIIFPLFFLGEEVGKWDCGMGSVEDEEGRDERWWFLLGFFIN